jgi:hypothetical protein
MRERVAKQKVTVLIPVEIVTLLKQVAERNQRSFKRELVWALQQYLEQKRNEKKE